MEEHALIGMGAIVGITLSSGSRTINFLKDYDLFMTEGKLKTGYNCDVADTDIHEQMKRKIFIELRSNTQEVTGGRAMKEKAEVEVCCKLACVDYETFYEQAKKDQKEEPKSWNALKLIAKEK